MIRGAAPTLACNLSAARGLRFVTRHGGWTPLTRTFTAGATAAEVRLAWADFDGYDGHDVDSVFIGQASVDGPFALVIDDVAIQ